MLADILGYEPRTGAAPGPVSFPTAASMRSRITVGAEHPASDRRRAPASHPHRRFSRSVGSAAHRAAGAFLLAAFTLSAFAPAAEAAKPSIPGNLSAAPQTSPPAVVVVVSWSPPTSDGGFALTGYEVEWRFDQDNNRNGNWGNNPGNNPRNGVKTAGPGATSVTFTDADGLRAENNYDFRITALNSNGERSFYSSDATATIGVVPVPTGTPHDFEVTQSSASVTVSWKPAQGWITKYRYQFRDPGPDEVFTSLSFTIQPPLTSITQNAFAGKVIRVAAGNAVGWGDWSAEILVEPPPGPPTNLRVYEAPDDPAVTGDDPRRKRIWLTWTPAADHPATGSITNYDYRVRDPDGSYGSVFESRDPPPYNVDNLAFFDKVIQLRAENDAGEGEWSEEFHIPPAPGEPPDPSTPTVTLVLTPARIAESGSGNSATLRATLSSAISDSATTITVEADPTLAVHFSGRTLTIPASQTASSGSITVTAVDNSDDAPDARVTISGTVAVVGSTAPNAPAGVTLTITDDDGDTTQPPPPPGGGGGGGGGAPPANNPATGAPAITGTAAVGQTLTAGQGTIADADGLAGVSYAWQWIRVDGSAETAIPGATGPTYLITDADLGGTLKVRAAFTDEAGNAESLTSAETTAVVAGTLAAQVTTAVEGALSAVARRAVTSALDTIGSRLTASMSASSLTLAGERVSPGADGATAAGTAMAGLAPPCPPGAVDAHGAGTAFGAARFVAADGCMGAGRTRGLATADLLGGSAFSLALGVAEGSPGFDPKAARWSLWGRGDLGSFEGRPEPGMRYDGDLTTGWLGVDARAGAWVAGVAVSHGTGDATYAFEDATVGAGQGRLETSLTAIYPYGRWTVAEGLEVHGVLGAGQGEVRHGLDDDPDTTSDLSMQMASVGLRHDLPALAGIDLAARADVHVARLETDEGPDTIHGLTADSWRARAGLEASRQIALDGDAALTPFVEAAARRDGGDGLEGSGLEVAGGLRYTAPRLELEARGRWLAAHSEDGAEEQGVSLTARVGPGAQGRGLSLALNPRWGAATGGAGALWREELPTAAGTPAGAALDARIGYGVVLPPYGVLTPFALTGLAETDRQRVGIGMRFAAPHLRFDVEVAGEHREGGARRPEQVLGVELGLQF